MLRTYTILGLHWMIWLWLLVQFTFISTLLYNAVTLGTLRREIRSLRTALAAIARDLNALRGKVDA